MKQSIFGKRLLICEYLRVMMLTKTDDLSASASSSLTFLQRFDGFLKIESTSAGDRTPKKRTKRSRSQIADKTAIDDAAIIRTLQRGFGDRVLAIEGGDEICKDNGDNEVVIGLRLNPASYQRVIDRGPAADSDEAKRFRQLWGEKSEMRKFADGAICEAVLWPANNAMERRRIVEHIAKFLLGRHFSIPNESVHMTQHTIESVLFTSPTFHWSRKQTTGEEQYRALSETYDKLANIFRSVDGLPLTLNRVQGISPSLRHTEVFLPLIELPVKGKASVYVHGDCLVPRPSGLFAPPWKPTHEVHIAFEASGKWPDDLQAIRKLKCAFYLKLSELLRDQFALRSRAFEDRLLITLGAFIFRVVIIYPREVALLKMKKDQRGMVVSRNTKEALAVEMATGHKPKHAAYILGVVHAHAAFALTCRLARRWICCHMLSHFVRFEAVELLVAAVYLDGLPPGPPGWAFSGFLRFLRLLVTHDWVEAPVIVNFNNELNGEQLSEIRSKFVSIRPTLPPICLVTPDDHVGSRWTRPQPTAIVTERLCNLAMASLEVLEANAFQLNRYVVRTVFQPALDVYDAVIRLKWRRVPKRYMALHLDGDADKKNTDAVTDTDEDDFFPVVDFDPVEQFLYLLREKYDRFAMFFYDSCGGDVIGVLFKPNARREDTQTTLEKDGTPERSGDGTRVKRNVDASQMIDNFSSLGKGIVREVKLLKTI